MPTLFTTVSSDRIAALVRNAQASVCYAAPGIQVVVAQAMLQAAKRLGPEALTVSIDFDERVFRLGYGSMDAIDLLRKAGVQVRSSPGLRCALVVVDEEGFLYTPTALLLEGEEESSTAVNALTLNHEQRREALSRLSPTAKAIAKAQARDSSERAQIEAIPIEVSGEPVSESNVASVKSRLELSPPLQFDVARQVRVYEAYLQYVDIIFSGASLQKHRLAIPKSISGLGGSRELEERMRTTFNLIDSDGPLSSKSLDQELKQIRDAFAPSLGEQYGRVLLKAKKPLFLERIADFRTKLDAHREAVKAGIQGFLDKTRNEIVSYYLPRVVAAPPDALRARTLGKHPTETEARVWLERELRNAVPKVEDLINDMKLDVRFKDVTYESLNEPGFLDAVREHFLTVDWDRAHDEFVAAGASVKAPGA